jgi:DegV family protein with EDD domain
MIRIVADTTSTITTDQAEKLGIFLLPQIIIFDEKSYRDDTELTTPQFLNMLKNSRTLPKTAAPAPALYTPIFEELTSRGDTIIVLCPSAKVSGTFRSATVAANDFPDGDIHIIDTEIIGPGLGYIVRKTLEWANSKMPLDDIIQQINAKCKSMRIYFYVDTLEYLHKGGRIGTAKALVGSVLQIKPILLFKDGQVQPFENQRTKKKALARIIELVKQDCPKIDGSYLAILEADAMEDALELKKEFSATMGFKEVTISDLPPAIVVHAGPGVIATSFFIE